jgi:two-component system sensor histidine kinase KdpD
VDDARPDPDALLRKVQDEERSRKRGRLTVFLGAAPGVGKTFAMLEEAGWQRDVEGRDVVAGLVETHGRFETATMLAGFERLPPRKVTYRGTTLEELDLDAALARRPALLLVDELAHTNAEGSRHPKRWQDVEELLDAGVEVMTTLNVQHIESLNDVVAQITGVVVRETVPDSVLERAGEVKLVDLPPDELLERLREGKVYRAATIERALEGFFRKGNLIALRELALRKTAERVDADMEAWRKAQGIERTWAASDKLLVCVSPSPFSTNLLRVGRRMAAGLRADWYAAYVETPAALRMSADDRARVTDNLRLAEQLGAEAVTLTGATAAEAVLAFARERDVTKIVAGKPRGRRLRDRLRRGFVDELILASEDIDIYVTVGEASGERATARVHGPRATREDARGHAYGVGATLLATLVAHTLFEREDTADIVMTYLLGFVLVSTRFGFRVSVATAVLGVLAFDFFFIPPT